MSKAFIKRQTLAFAATSLAYHGAAALAIELSSTDSSVPTDSSEKHQSQAAQIADWAASDAARDSGVQCGWPTHGGNGVWSLRPMPVARYAKSIRDRAGWREENYVAAIVGGLVRLAQGKSVSLGGLVPPDKQASRASSPQGGLADAAAGRVLEAREDKEVLMSMKELEGLVEGRCVQGIEEEEAEPALKSAAAAREWEAAETHSLFAGLKDLAQLSTASGSPKTTSEAKGKAKASGKMITVKEDLSVPVKEQEEEGPLGVTQSLDVFSGTRAGQAVEGENDPVAVVEGEAGHEAGSNKNVESEQTVEHKMLEGVQLASTSLES